MREIVKAIALENYHLEITFDDGATGVVDIRPLMERSIFQPLRDKSFFAQVEIDHKFGGVKWRNGADICIDWIEGEIGRQKPLVKFA